MTENQLIKIIDSFYQQFPQRTKKNKEELKNFLLSEVAYANLLKILKVTSERSILEVFIDEDSSYELREEIAKNRNAPEDILDTLAKDPIDWIKLAVSNNISTSTATLQHLARYSRSSAAKSNAKSRLSRRKDRSKSELQKLTCGEATFSLKDSPFIVLNSNEEVSGFHRFELTKECFKSENDYPRPNTHYVAQHNGILYVSHLIFAGEKCYVILLAEIEKISVNEYKIIQIVNEYFDFDEL